MPSSKIKQAAWNVQRRRYPKNWPSVKKRIRARSGGRCECTGECGRHTFERCIEVHGEQGKTMRGIVHLQVMHLNHQPEDTRDEILMDGCPGCHLRYDKIHHARNARKTKAARKGQIDWVDEEEVRRTAMYLRMDVEAHKMSVILVPAPEQRHEMHMIRVVADRPPSWYLSIAARWGYDRLRRGRFERLHFLHMLLKVEKGEKPWRKSPYYDAACAIVRKAIEVPEEVFCA